MTAIINFIEGCGAKMHFEADFVMELTVELGEIIEVGKTQNGYLRLIPIIGGNFSGANIKGRVVPGGYDWNTTINAHTVHALAKYAIETDDGVFISVENEGYLDSAHPDSIVKTSPKFEVAEGKYEWLQNGVFCGCLEVMEGAVPAVKIKIYKMK